jgi:hypothetical protein
MTLADIENLHKDFLIPSDIASLLHVHQYSISVQARTDPAKLGFAVIVVGNKTLIPKGAFVKFCKGENI